VEVEATARALRARLLGRVLAPPRGVHAATGLAPEDDPDVARAELELAAEPLMVVGHLPHLARLAAALVGAALAEPIRFTPGTAVALRRGRDGWTPEVVVPSHAGGPP
jgi:phosphohistidine phosphatase